MTTYSAPVIRNPRVALGRYTIRTTYIDDHLLFHACIEEVPRFSMCAHGSARIDERDIRDELASFASDAKSARLTYTYHLDGFLGQQREPAPEARLAYDRWNEGNDEREQRRRPHPRRFGRHSELRSGPRSGSFERAMLVDIERRDSRIVRHPYVTEHARAVVFEDTRLRLLEIDLDGPWNETPDTLGFHSASRKYVVVAVWG